MNTTNASALATRRYLIAAASLALPSVMLTDAVKTADDLSAIFGCDQTDCLDAAILAAYLNHSGEPYPFLLECMEAGALAAQLADSMAPPVEEILDARALYSFPILP